MGLFDNFVSSIESLQKSTADTFSRSFLTGEQSEVASGSRVGPRVDVSSIANDQLGAFLKAGGSRPTSVTPEEAAVTAAITDFESFVKDTIPSLQNPPRLPKPPSTPSAPPSIPTLADAAAGVGQNVKLVGEKIFGGGSRGRQSTILTGGRGSSGPVRRRHLFEPESQGSTLLGIGGE